MNNFATIFRQIELKVQLWTMSGIEEMLQRIYDMQIKHMRAIEKIDSREAKIAALLSQAPPPPPPEPPVLKTNNDSKQADLKRKLQLLKMIKRRRSSGTR